jgi:hypothetical protein
MAKLFVRPLGNFLEFLAGANKAVACAVWHAALSALSSHCSCAVWWCWQAGGVSLPYACACHCSTSLWFANNTVPQTPYAANVSGHCHQGEPLTRPCSTWSRHHSCYCARLGHVAGVDRDRVYSSRYCASHEPGLQLAVGQCPITHSWSTTHPAL